MRILTYKRIHIGDPDLSGRFGIKSCMGRMRAYEYEAVIGIGGKGADAKQAGIANRINWVGLISTRHKAPIRRACDVTFDYFVYLVDKGPLLSILAPNLAKRMYEKGARFLLKGYTETEYKEALKIIKWSKTLESSETTIINRL